jgi:putative DNA primase/helicase
VNIADRFAIPVDLRDRRQWVAWRHVERDGKATKVPYKASKPSVRASTTDPRTWGVFEHAAAAVASGKADGIGFVFSPDDPFCGIDLDGCRDESGELNRTAAAIVEQLDSYTEVSPSGRGAHVIVRGKLEGGRCRRGPVELYDRGRYFCMTGERLAGLPHSPMPRQEALDELRHRLFPTPVDTDLCLPANGSARSIPQDDRELLDRAFAARNGADVERLFNGDTSGYGSHSEADLALVAHLAFWTDGDATRIDALFRASGLYRDKWERADYRERTIAKALQ